MPRKPRVLYVTRALVAPPHAGCMIRTTNVFRQLCKVADATMLAVSHNFDPDSVGRCEKEFDAFARIDLKPYTAYPNLRGRFLKKWHMHWPTSHGIQADEAGQELFSRLVCRHDVVWFHTLGAAHPFRKQKLPCSVMDLDDLNHCKYDLRSRHDANFRFRCSAKVQAYKWKRHEVNALTQYGLVVVCSEYDKKYLAAPNVHVVPNGFSAPPQKPEWTMPDPDRLGFIGSLGYPPNRDGLIWFRDNVWPLIRKEKPQMQLQVVGSLPPLKDRVEGEGFNALGFVEDPTEEMKTWSAMIVPITYGGGTRIKILDAFSKMCPVVATSIGAHGIQAGDESIYRTNDPSVFSRYCLELVNNPESGRKLAEKAWTIFENKYTWDIIGEQVKRVLDILVSGRC